MSRGSSDESVSVFGHGTGVTVIREMYDGVNAHELFENELETALESGCDTIIIEPQRLGEATARWIAVGDCLHKTAVASGVTSVVCCCLWPRRPLLYCPTSAVSLLCAGFYNLSWENDPCSKYSVESGQKEASIQSLISSSTPAPVVLVKRNEDTPNRRNFLHSAISLIAIAFSVWKWYKWVKFTVV